MGFTGWALLQPSDSISQYLLPPHVGPQGPIPAVKGREVGAYQGAVLTKGQRSSNWRGLSFWYLWIFVFCLKNQSRQVIRCRSYLPR